MNYESIIKEIQKLIKESIEKANVCQMDWLNVEEAILKLLNIIGTMISQEILNGVIEPIDEKDFIKDGKRYIYSENRNLSFICRFGSKIEKLRRCYKNATEGGSYSPLDEKLGFRNCKGFSPLMTYLQSLFGCNDGFTRSGERLGEVLGFSVSATAVQNNTEHIGKIIPEEPKDFLPSGMDGECDLMIAEVDGTTSPQIQEQDGLAGRESLKMPTEYKECNLIVIEKHKGDKVEKVYGGRYGIRAEFREYSRKFGIIAGKEKAKVGVFLGDGEPSNWELANAYYPDFIQILDFYHADEHVHNFIHLFKNKSSASQKIPILENLLYDGKPEELISEMNRYLSEIPKKNISLAEREIKYIDKNKDRMRYTDYRKLNLPIGSGMIEASCKLVVCKRFKGNGMRWKKKDNSYVLRVRLAYLNGTLKQYFFGNKEKWLEEGVA